MNETEQLTTSSGRSRRNSPQAVAGAGATHHKQWQEPAQLTTSSGRSRRNSPQAVAGAGATHHKQWQEPEQLTTSNGRSRCNSPQAVAGAALAPLSASPSVAHWPMSPPPSHTLESWTAQTSHKGSSTTVTRGVAQHSPGE